MGSRAAVWGLLVTAACGGGGGFPDARSSDAPAPIATFSLAWTVTDASGQAITCDRIGAQSITVTAHNVDFEGSSTEVFVCSTGRGTSQGLPPGVYDFDFELDASSGQLATTASQHTITLTSGQNTPLAPLTFAVDATGAVSLSIASGKAGGNCGAIASGGAGITATTITLVHNSDSSCAPLTLAISAGATQPAGNYTIDCAAPLDGPCIEHDQFLTATGIASDSYTIHVRGKVAATPCWTNDDSLQVPPLGRTLSRTLNLAFAMGMSGC